MFGLPFNIKVYAVLAGFIALVGAGSFLSGRYLQQRPVVVRHETKVATKAHQVAAATTASTATTISSLKTDGSHVGHTSAVISGNRKKVKKLTRTTLLHDPKTGRVISQTTLTLDTDDQTTTTSSNDSATAATTTTVTNSSGSTTLTTSSNSTIDTASVTTEKHEELNTQNSHIGVGVTTSGKALITYDVIKIGKLAGAVAVEADLSTRSVSGVGVAVLANIAKDGRYYVGAYGELKLKEKKTEVGICAGIRF